MADEHEPISPPFWSKDPFAEEDDGPTVIEVATKAMNEEADRRQAAAAAEAITDAAGGLVQATETAGRVAQEVVGHLTDVFPDEEPDDRTPLAKTLDNMADDYRSHHQMQLPDDPPSRVAPGGLTHVRDDATVADFLEHALAQVGDKYQRGAEARFDDADPDRWDGSELVEWAANRAGVMVNDGAANQYRQMIGQDGALSVEDALHTPGAILYEFTGDPINGQPTRASTAISLGDGRIIDIDPKGGVRIVDASAFTFTHAAVMPGFTDAHDPGAGATDVVHQALVEHGIEEAAPPVDDTPEITALAERAAELRAQYANTAFGEGRTERGEHHSEVEREQKLAEVGLQMANEEATSRVQKADERLARAADLEQQASAAESRGDASGAQELREDAARTRLAGESDQNLAGRAQDDAAKYQQQVDAAKSEMAKIDEATGPRFELVGKGEDALDQLEHKVELMRTAHAQATLVTDLERRETDARAAGDTAQADQLAKQAQSARATADRMQQAADAAPVDEPTLQQIQALDPLATPGTTPDATPTPATSTGADEPDTPDTPDTPATPDIEQLAQRAAHLREQSLAAIRQEMDDREQEYTDVKKEQLQAASVVEYAQLRAQASREELQEVQARANEDELRAVEAEAKGDTRAAEELREHAARILVVGRAREGQSAKLDAEHEEYKAQAAQLQQRLDTLKAASEARIEKLNHAEDAIDALEDRVRSLREIQTQTAIAEDLDRQAAATRAGGSAAEAQELEDEAAAHRTAAEAVQTRLDATPVDESSLQVLEDVDVTTVPSLGSPPAAPASDDEGSVSAPSRAPRTCRLHRPTSPRTTTLRSRSRRPTPRTPVSPRRTSPRSSTPLRRPTRRRRSTTTTRRRSVVSRTTRRGPPHRPTRVASGTRREWSFLQRALCN